MRRKIMKTNKIMNKLLRELKSNNTILQEEFLNPEFIEWQGCVLLKWPEIKLGKLEDMNYLDKTDFETSNNHIHLDDFTTGIELLNKWKSELTKKYKDKQFIFVMSCNPEGTDVVIRFYQYRTDEPEWIERNNLENYKEEALMIIEHLYESR
jgi:hypothetical protein